MGWSQHQVIAFYGLFLKRDICVVANNLLDFEYFRNYNVLDFSLNFSNINPYQATVPSLSPLENMFTGGNREH